MLLRWAFIFLIIALVAALFGFTGVADVSAGIAKVLFVIFLLTIVVAAGLFIAAIAGVRRLFGSGP